jgi:hypothetical protein
MSTLYANNILTFDNIAHNKGVLLASANKGNLGSDTNGVVIYTAGTYGSRVYSLFFSTSDNTDDNIYLYILNGSTVYPIGNIHVPANSGNSASILPVNAFDPSNCPGLPLNDTGKPYIELAPNSALKAVGNGSLTAVYVSAVGADF